MPSVTLEEAARKSYDNLSALWALDGVKAALAAFATASLPIFDEGDVKTHPVSNWLIIIASQANQLPSVDVTIDDLSTAAHNLYRCCFVAFFLNGTVPQQLSNAQATALLTAYNANFPL